MSLFVMSKKGRKRNKKKEKERKRKREKGKEREREINKRKGSYLNPSFLPNDSLVTRKQKKNQ